MIAIRQELPADLEAVLGVNRRAFGGEDEARIVEALHGAEGCLSLVAVTGGAVVGHILFSPVTVGGATGPFVGLAPLAVVPAHQRGGIGARLVQDGLEACRNLGHAVVFVLGEPGYYGRFGFRPASSAGCHFPGARDSGAFQLLELLAGGLVGRSGEVRYRPEFYL